MDQGSSSWFSRLLSHPLCDRVLNLYKCLVLTAVAVLLLVAVAVLGALSTSAHLTATDTARLRGCVDGGFIPLGGRGRGIPVYVAGGEVEVAGGKVEAEISNWYELRWR